MEGKILCMRSKYLYNKNNILSEFVRADFFPFMLKSEILKQNNKIYIKNIKF